VDYLQHQGELYSGALRHKKTRHALCMTQGKRQEKVSCYFGLVPQRAICRADQSVLI